MDLTCHLSAINSAREQTNFSVVPSEHTYGLTVKCLDPAPGRLEPAGFAGLRHLRKLRLEGCHLSDLPDRAFWGLDKLRNLKVHCLNIFVIFFHS